MAAAVPLAIKGGSMLGGALLGKLTSGASKEQKAAQQGTANAANAVGQYATPMVRGGMQMANQGGQFMNDAGGYYRNILNNRRAGREALAPEMKTAMDFYAGASRKAGRTMRGGARTQALAELDREKVGNMAMMLPQARANAAEGAANIGSNYLNAASNFTGQGINAANAAGNIYNAGFNQAGTIRNQEAEGGKAWGGLLYDTFSGMAGLGGKSSGGTSSGYPPIAPSPRVFSNVRF